MALEKLLCAFARAWRSILAPAALALLTGVGPASADDAPGGQPDELLVGFHGGVSDTDADNSNRAAGARKIEMVRGLNIQRVVASGASVDATERALARDPRVKFVERNRQVSPDFTVNDPSFSSQWHLPAIAAPAAWDVAPGAAGIVIAVVDSGVDGTHPDLSSRMVAGYNFYSNNTDTSDVDGHGTWVAGTVAAAGNNGIGVTGVAWQSTIMPVRVADSSGVAYVSAIANGITWAADHGAKVINVSFSGVAGSPTLASAAQYARTKGAVVVASAGNCACLDPVAENVYILSVSATDQNDNLASFSSRGDFVDISAPGVSILTTQRGGGYVSTQGTSFSSPIVAGVVALAMSANPALQPVDIVTLVKANADDRGGAGWDQSFGYGRVNAYRAAAAAAGSVALPDTVPPTVAITAPSPGAVLSGIATLAVSASDNGAVSRVDLHVDGAFFGSDTAEPYSFSWDTRNTTNGPHTLVATAVDAAGNIGTSATVTVTVSNLLDTTPPVVTITSASVSGTTLNVSVAATDNVGVTRVELYIDGQFTATRLAPPYTFAQSVGSLSAGSHTIQARAYDAVWNVGVSPTVAVTVGSPPDSMPPVATITSSSVSGTTLNVAVSATDNVGVTRVELYIDGALTATRLTPPYTFAQSVSSLSAGSHAIQARAYDAAGNVGVSATTTVTVGSLPDTTPPVVSIASASVSGTTLNVSVAATDNVGVTRVELYIDGQFTATRLTPPYTFAQSVSSLSAGSHTIQARAYDAVWNVGVSPTVAVTVGSLSDTAPPVLTITSSSVSGTTLNVAVSATDNVGVTRVELYIDGALTATRLTPPYTFAQSVSSLSAGSHAIQARAYDAAGNVGVSATTTVTVGSLPDTTPPVVSIASASVSGTTLNVSVAATDNVGVTRVELYIDGQFTATRLTPPYTFAQSVSSLSAGSHTIQARAYDAVWNVGVSPAVAVTVGSLPDTAPPVVTITSSSVSGTTLNVAVSATDNVGVTRVELYIDGQFVATRLTLPYTFAQSISSLSPGGHTIQARAYDAVWNVGVSPYVGFATTASAPR